MTEDRGWRTEDGEQRTEALLASEYKYVLFFVVKHERREQGGPFFFSHVPLHVNFLLIFIFSKEAQCRVSPLLNVLDIIACDCSDGNLTSNENRGGGGDTTVGEGKGGEEGEEGKENCFAESSEGAVVAAGWACPFTETVIQVFYFRPLLSLSPLSPPCSSSSPFSSPPLAS
jgi:hypothetical protein